MAETDVERPTGELLVLSCTWTGNAILTRVDDATGQPWAVGPCVKTGNRRTVTAVREVVRNGRD